MGLERRVSRPCFAESRYTAAMGSALDGWLHPRKSDVARVFNTWSSKPGKLITWMSLLLMKGFSAATFSCFIDCIHINFYI